MSITNKIAKDKRCINYAKNIGGKYYKDFFNDAIERILIQESKGKVFDGRFRYYFYQTLISVRGEFYRSRKIQEVEIKNHNQTELKDDENLYKQALYNFINKTYKDSDLELARLITELSLTMNKKDISKETGYPLAFIYRKINIAKKIIKHEYDRIILY